MTPSSGPHQQSTQEDPPHYTLGYASLMEFMSSDSVFLIFRRFDRLATRNLLYLQEELSVLEERLRCLDQQDGTQAGEDGLRSLHSWHEDKNMERKRVVLEIRQKLELYREFLGHHQTKTNPFTD
jgi:hypothetical protein